MTVVVLEDEKEAPEHLRGMMRLPLTRARRGMIAVEGIRVVEAEAPDTPRGRDRVVADDPEAPPMRARFYEIGSNKTLFVDRDGVPKPSLAAISYERRNGYQWLGYWPQRILNREYPEWDKRLGKVPQRRSTPVQRSDPHSR
jgi:hypothetical protein